MIDDDYVINVIMIDSQYLFLPLVAMVWIVEPHNHEVLWAACSTFGYFGPAPLKDQPEN